MISIKGLYSGWNKRQTTTTTVNIYIDSREIKEEKDLSERLDQNR